MPGPRQVQPQEQLLLAKLLLLQEQLRRRDLTAFNRTITQGKALGLADWGAQVLRLSCDGVTLLAILDRYIKNNADTRPPNIYSEGYAEWARHVIMQTWQRLMNERKFGNNFYSQSDLEAEIVHDPARSEPSPPP